MRFESGEVDQDGRRRRAKARRDLVLGHPALGGVPEHASPAGPPIRVEVPPAERSLVEAAREEALRELSAHARTPDEHGQQLAVGHPELRTRDVGVSILAFDGRLGHHLGGPDGLVIVHRGVHESPSDEEPFDRAAALLGKHQMAAVFADRFEQASRVDRAVRDARVMCVALEVVDSVRVDRSVQDRFLERGRGSSMRAVDEIRDVAGREAVPLQNGGNLDEGGGPGGVGPLDASPGDPLVAHAEDLGHRTVERVRERAVAKVVEERRRCHAPPRRLV